MRKNLLTKWFWAMALFLPLILAMPTAETQAQATQTGHRKLALLVGISTYERGKQQPPDWWNLDCENDVKQMKQVLVTRFGFEDKNVTTLTTKAQTTRESILAAFHQLIDTAQPGDIVWFHYSGHGQQVPELQEGQQLNGLDSSLIPSNYTDQHAGTVDPTTHKPVGNINIRGTEMAELLNELKAKTGPTGSITLSIDCCFAGSATRGVPTNGRLKERGRGWNEALDGPRPGTAKKTTRGDALDAGAGFLPPSESNKGGYVLLAATSINETAKEKDDDNQQPMGAFTYYLVKELSRIKPESQMTYRELFERLQTDIVGNVRDQSPQAEGDLDKPLLGGARVVPDAAYVRVTDGDAESHTVTLGAGELEGVSVGSQYALYPPGTTNFKDASKRIATVTVSDIDLNDATATLDAKYQATVKAKSLLNARAYETAHKYGDNALKVALTGLAGTPTEAQFKAQMKTSQVANISTDAHWDVRIQPAPKERGGATGPALAIERQDGTTITTVPQDDSAAANLSAALSNEWKWQYINKLQNNDADSGIKLEMRLVPVEVAGVPGKTRGVWKKRNSIRNKPLPANGALTLNPGDNYVIEVRNTGYKDAYVTILDLTADGQVSCWYPGKDDHVREPIKGEGENATWHRLPEDYMLYSTAPYGAEFFKAIGTDEPADFSSLVSDAQNGTKRGGEDNPASRTPLGRLLLDGLKGQRGGAAVEPSDWGTASATLINKAPDAPERGIPAMSK
ncbi:MAG: caspase family protein [Armatimonadota bacterium]|nr:caspase family protein [Armatimonadota bacterium]